ncbi:MAG: AbiEi antitoxin N-terminal domain-containing protein [Rhodoferax sp.]|nr:AbiEi antitoxin N-terminal domain-containing protein [Rhodoferax sp.]
MTPPTNPQQVLDLARQNGLLRASQMQALGIGRVVLTRLTASGQLERVGRGVYRLPGTQASEHESLATLAVRVPQAVFCLLTALQLHGLTTQLPRQVWIAMPQGSHAPTLDYPPVKMVQFSGDAYSQGVETIHAEQVPLRVYGVAKTVADCFKHRNKIGLDVALEALKDALGSRKTSADELWRYAKVCRVANVMRPYLEALGHGA